MHTFTPPQVGAAFPVDRKRGGDPTHRERFDLEEDCQVVQSVMPDCTAGEVFHQPERIRPTL